MNDLYQAVTDQLVAALEQGCIPWIKPWTSAYCGHQPFPINALSRRPYSGINLLLLWSAAQRDGFGQDRWLTFNQARKAGGHIRKGERSTLCVLYKPMQREARDAAGNRLLDDAGNPQWVEFALLKTHWLFNVEQTEGLEAILPPEPEPLSTFDANARAEQILQDSGARIVHRNGDEAFYHPLRDLIQLPERSQFASAGGYYATALHELTHWSGHASRLNREGCVAPVVFGAERYAFEELVAEMGAAFLCVHSGVQGELRHAGYLATWLQALKADKKAIFRASGLAREASQYLLNLGNIQALSA